MAHPPILEKSLTIPIMLQLLEKYGKSTSAFTPNTTIHVWNKMEKKYTYTLQEPIGRNYDPTFTPELTPPQMLRLGIFEGKYLNDCLLEYPMEWFIDAIAFDKLRPEGPDPQVNLFQIKSRQPLSMWNKNKWIQGDDERGWFQWYCRYYMGRRDPLVDTIQIGRWKSFTRHAGAIRKNCKSGDLTCRPRQRQALLQWAYNPFI